MPLGVALSELRYELRAEIYSSLLPAHGLSAVDMQNTILERTQRELWNLYAWPHLNYSVDIIVPAGTVQIMYDSTMPFENVLSLWYNDNLNATQPWFQLRYGFEDWINETLQSYPPKRWRNSIGVDPTSGLTYLTGVAQLWPIPSQTVKMRWRGQAPLNPLKVDSDQCLIDSTAIVLTAAAELLGAQKSETAALKGQKAQAYIRRLLGRSGANKRDISAMGQGWRAQPTNYGGATPYLDYIPGPYKMPVYQIQDFKSGLDLRKSYATAPAGSLRTLRNCIISAGAEIEKRTAFILFSVAPAGSFGALSRNGEFFVVVNGPSGITDWVTGPPATSHPGVISLPFPVPMSRVADWDLFNGQFYIVMAGTNGLYYHFYNQVQVTDPMATASSVRTFGSKMYGVDGRLLRFSAINNPTKWTPPTGTTNDGSGYVDLSAQDADSTNLIGLEVYLGNMAVFSSLSTQIWKLDPDPSLNQFVQLLRSTGLLASQGLVQFGQDVLYVSSHGVRSLKVQNVSLTAGTTDIGTPIDEVFRDLIIQNGAAWFAGARTLIQPRSGRVMVVLQDRIYMLSTFQEPAITAWSSFDAPFNFVDACVADPWVLIRGSDNNLYIYGSDVAAIYDATEAEVITPALSCDSSSKNKLFHAFDVGAEGTWTLSVGCDPNNQATEEEVATFTGSTFVNPTMSMPESSTHISLRFRSTDTTRARIGQVNLLFDDGSTD